jgi:RNA polymerase-binding transcription factor DksA
MTSEHVKPAADAVRTRLLARRSELGQRLERVDHDASHRSDPVSADFEEQANQTSNDEVLAAIGQTVRTEISDIDAALGRLAAGRYGICARCGMQIEPARLSVVPYTLTCAGCAA